LIVDEADFRAYNLQDLGNDTVQANLLLRHPADARSYTVATSILMDLNLPRIALLTNNPDKIIAVEGPNKEIKVEKRVRMIPRSWRGEVGVEGKEVGEYLKTKVRFIWMLLT
jgi:GTP cyclohydrolase II